MLRRSKSRTREIYFHEDDYCQQQLLPCEAADYANAEIRKITEFANAHRDPGGAGWTDVYARKHSPCELRTLNLTRELFASAVATVLPPFDIVYTGYGSHREQCKRTGAWGISQTCALFADWSDNGVITNVWAGFFDNDEAAIRTAANAIAAASEMHPLIYVDWAWGYMCEASDQQAFASLLSKKLGAIEANS